MSRLEISTVEQMGRRMLLIDLDPQASLTK
ncbi:ParA family protein [Deinococcus fonticola]|nr:ParA family protein [Deinococcus fonticola]